MALTPLKAGRGEWGLYGGEIKASVLQLRLSVFKVWTWVAGQSEVIRFGGGAIRLRRCGRRVMTGVVNAA
jgi:hypothetical protein